MTRWQPLQMTTPYTEPAAVARPTRLRRAKWVVLLVVWSAAASGSGYLLARLARRLHPELSLRKLWFFYTVLTATLVAIVFLLGWF